MYICAIWCTCLQNEDLHKKYEQRQVFAAHQETASCTILVHSMYQRTPAYQQGGSGVPFLDYSESTHLCL